MLHRPPSNVRLEASADKNGNFQSLGCESRLWGKLSLSNTISCILTFGSDNGSGRRRYMRYAGSGIPYISFFDLDSWKAAVCRTSKINFNYSIERLILHL